MCGCSCTVYKAGGCVGVGVYKAGGCVGPITQTEK